MSPTLYISTAHGYKLKLKPIKKTNIEKCPKSHGFGHFSIGRIYAMMVHPIIKDK